MKILFSKLKSVLTITAILFLTAGTLCAQSPDLEILFKKLKKVGAVDAPALEAKILLEWSKSGSAAIDYLLTRAKVAINAQDYKVALQHLNALTDHAPEFAEGWNLTAVVLYQLGEAGPALAAIEQALALESRHFKALEGLMFILEDAGLFVKAFEVFQMIEAIHPHAEILSTVRDRLDAKTQGQAL